MMDKWHKRYLSLAKEIATWSKDPSSKVGAIVVRDGQILSVGYNGFPRGIEDSTERLNNRQVKYGLVVHAEKNAIYNACYNGVSLVGGSIYVYGLPICGECALGIIQVGITSVYIAQSCLDLRPEWKESWQKSTELFEEAGVNIIVV